MQPNNGSTLRYYYTGVLLYDGTTISAMHVISIPGSNCTYLCHLQATIALTMKFPHNDATRQAHLHTSTERCHQTSTYSHLHTKIPLDKHIFTPPHNDATRQAHLHTSTQKCHQTSTYSHLHTKIPLDKHIFTPPHKDTTRQGHLCTST